MIEFGPLEIYGGLLVRSGRSEGTHDGDALYNDIRMQALEIANELERAEELVIQGLEEAGIPPQKTKGVYNPRTLYDALIHSSMDSYL